MSKSRNDRTVLLGLVMTATLGFALADVDGPLHPAGAIELPDISGRMDHLAIDLTHGQLFVAALGAGEVEVVDLRQQRRMARLKGLQEVQGIAYSPTLGRVFAAVGGTGELVAFEGEQTAKRVEGLPDADNLRLSPSGDTLYLGFGEALATIDAKSLAVWAQAKLPGHPEGFQVEARGTKVYVNVPTAGQVVVLDRDSGKTLATWSVSPQRANFPMVLDETGRRLYVGTRSPARLIVWDTTNGQRIADSPLCGDVDDLFFDGKRRRIYAVCGEGFVDVFETRGDGQLERVQRLATAAGARTGLFVPQTDTLYVAAPRHWANEARILVFISR